jgi:Ca-activated chloride channel homolog
MSFGHVWVLVLIPIYFIAELIHFYTIRSNAAALPGAAFIPVLHSWRNHAVRARRYLPPVLAVLLLLGLSSPESVQTREQVLPSGIDIMVVLDVSGSMAAEDFKPVNRLEGAKEVLKSFIRGRPSDRIGLVVFGGRSVSRSPLTLQHETLNRTLASVKMGELPEGTAIGMAIMSGINRLMVRQDTNKKGSRIMILITDGRNNGEIHPLDAVRFAGEHKVKIYTIGVGGFGPAPYPVLTPEGKTTYRYEKADLDENLLKTIAARTGGTYFRATDPESMSLLFRQIDQLEKSNPEILQRSTLNSESHALTIPLLLIAACYVALTMTIVRLP